MSDVIKFGRIQYIEPNEIFGGDNQPVNQEDLSKYVNLSVKIPSRYYKENNWVKSYDTILQGESFDNVGEYTKFYLTDNYVNVSYTEFKKNGEISAGELFGIDSIDISFDVQFFPQVTINFTDIKGFGLMSTMEYNYSEGKINDITAKSFFTSLFNFPYPIFTLEVKGYYGKSVNFDLSLSDFHTAFDSTTGNFKTTVKFIGHMYGVYTDIPMSYLMVSPYLFCNVVLTGNTMTNGDTYSSYWESIREGYPTYLEFINAFNNILIGDFDSNNLIENTRTNKEKLPFLIEADGLLDKILKICQTSREKYICLIVKPLKDWVSGKINTVYINKKNSSSVFREWEFYKIPHNLNTPKGDFLITTDLLNESGVFRELMPLDENIDINRLRNYDDDVTKYNEIADKIGLKRLTIKEFTQFESVYTNTNYDFNISFDPEIKVAQYVDLVSISDDIKKQIKNIQETEKGNKEKIKESLRRIVTNAIGFDPCIENYYKLLFKHLQCFTSIFNSTIKNVNSKISSYERNLNTILNGYNTDVSINMTDEYENDTQVPQFPLVRNDNMEIIYPGDIETFKNEPEIELVDEIYKSMVYFGTNSRNVFNSISNNRTIITRGIINSDGLLFNDILPNNFYDEFNETQVNIVKNYAILNDRRSGIKTVDELVNTIKKLFLSRLCLYNRIHAPKNDYWKIGYTTDAAGVAESEANLLYFNFTELHDLYPDFYEKLKKISADDIVSTFNTFNGLEYGIINYKPGMETATTSNELYKYDIHVNDISSSVLVLEKGGFEKCSNYLKEIGFEGRKNEDNAITSAMRESSYDKEYIKGKKEIRKDISVYNVGVKKYTNEETAYIEGMNCDTLKPTSIGSITDIKYNTNYYLQSSFNLNRKNYTAHIIYTPKIYANSAFLNWALSCNKYYWSGRQKADKICDGGVGITKFNLGSNSDTSRINQNRISLVKLYQLRALGEFFEHQSEGCIIGCYNEARDRQFLYTSGDDLDDYYITDKNLLPYINSFYCGFEGELDGPFKEFCIKCYKKEIYGEINEDEEENYYLVIAKSQQFPNNNTGMTEENILEYWRTFCTEVEKKYGITSKYDVIEEYETRMEKEKEILNLKTNIYYTLKNLYDKWFCSLNFSIFDTKSDISEIGKFKFLNMAMGDISNEMVFNYETSLLHLEETLKGSISVMEFMAQIAEKNKSTFLTLPINIFDNNSEDGLRNIFKPFSFYNQTTNHDSHGVSYIFIHNGDVSHNLNINDSEYVDDGYDMVKYSSSGLKESEIAQKIFNDHDSIVNAFGVTYGMQNQNFFKNISVDTSTPTITDYSIANTIVLAEGGNNATGLNNIAFKEKSLYPIYANRSYNCTVEMLGCMQITPLMYFQLNNIPMFRGAYIITNVNHKITPNDFTTIFTGVRVSKYKIPINVETISLSLLGFGRVNNNQTEENDNTNHSNAENDDTNHSNAENIGPVTTIETVMGENFTFKTIDANKKYWFPYNGFTKGRRINGEQIYGCGDDCMASVKKSIAMIVKQDYHETCSAATNYTSSSYVVQLLHEKYDSSLTGGSDYNLYYEESGANKNIAYNKKEKYENCINYITNMIDNGHPVCVGVAHSVKRPNNTKKYTGLWLNDGITDHFLCIYAYASNNNKKYFKYYESGRNGQNDCASDENILIYDPNNNKPLFYCPKSKRNTKLEKNKRYDVSQIRINSKYSNYLTDYSQLVGPQRNVNDDRTPFIGGEVCVSRSNENRYLYQKGVK